MPARMTVLSGPSGVGKGTVVTALRAILPRVWVSISCTTRPPRPGETDGVQYHFLTDDQFTALAERDELLEWAHFAGFRYGTPREPVASHLSDDVPTLLEIDLAGARQVRAAMPQSRFVFLAPPSVDVLVGRLAGRGTESEEQVAHRLALAQAELAAAGEFDHVVVNHDVIAAAREVADLIGDVRAP